MIAKIHGVPVPDYKNMKWLITFEIEQDPLFYDDLKDKTLNLELREHKKKRSLDANAYCWVLCSKLADELKSSKDEVYEEMIQRYSVPDYDDNGYITITILERIPIEKIGGHWKFIKRAGQFRSYLRLKGSSEMDSKEMSNLLDGIVTECKEMGIETATPEELERMKQQWGKKEMKDHSQ